MQAGIEQADCQAGAGWCCSSAGQIGETDRIHGVAADGQARDKLDDTQRLLLCEDYPFFAEAGASSGIRRVSYGQVTGS